VNRGALRAEESLFSWTLNQREIPHFVRNDNRGHFSAACIAAVTVSRRVICGSARLCIHRPGFLRRTCKQFAIGPEWQGKLSLHDGREFGSNNMTKHIFLLPILILLLGPAVFSQGKENDRIKNAGTVMAEILNVPDNIPQDLLDKAECVLVLPSVLRFAIVFGGSYGRGVMTCRSGKDFMGPWGAPTMMALEGGSFGFQLGGQATDFVLLVMNRRGADSILSSKVKLGAGISAAAGPKGRDASAATDVALRAEVLSYSRSRGLFAGIYLEGSTLRPDKDANKRIYKSEISAKEIVLEGKASAPPAAQDLLSVLNKRSPKNLSEQPKS
jgi:lipid-binding SYLF domain-containing protein